MKKTVANLPASVRQRLLNLATERKQDFGLVLTHYGLERLLYRLSVSLHRDSFVRRTFHEAAFSTALLPTNSATQPCGLTPNHGHRFKFASSQTAIGCIEDFLVLPSLFSRNREDHFAFECGGERVQLASVGIGIR